MKEHGMRNRAPSEFMQIRPCGKIDDRKCDGLLFEGGVVFQVNSPDELKTVRGPGVDRGRPHGCLGALGNNGLMRWTFVYRCR
jgi:hypothetical protein